MKSETVPCFWTIGERNCPGNAKHTELCVQYKLKVVMPLKKILIIHTGGTIGMFPTDHGYAPSKEDFHRVLALIPELSAPSVPAWDLIDMEPVRRLVNTFICAVSRKAQMHANLSVSAAAKHGNPDRIADSAVRNKE